MSCIFCDIINGTRKGHFLYSDDQHVVFLDKYPIDIGHSLIVPRSHHELITDMSPNDVGSIFSLVPMIASAILKATSADAFSLAQNNGYAAKQIVPHVHIHIIPRYNERGTVWTKRDIADDADLAALATKIRATIDNII